MTKVVTSFLAGAAADIAEQITTARDDLGKADPAEKDVDTILAALDFSDWDELAKSVLPQLVGITKDGVVVAFDQLGVDADTDLTGQVNEQAVAWARDRAAALVGMTWDDDGNLVENPKADMAITDGTREMLRSAVARAIEEGTSTSDFGDEIKDEYAFSGTRAERIARFEIAQADVQGNMIAYRDSGVVSGKEVILGSEHAGPDECDDAAAMGVVPLDDDFGGAGDPPFHPGCVCDVLPVLDEEEGA